MMRNAVVERNTRETKIRVSLELDGSGKADIDTGIGFFNHMLELLAFHSGMNLCVHADGDLDVDDHHTIEDTGIAFGMALRKALGDKKGIERYGFFLLPMDEALAEVALDFSGRPVLVFDVSFRRDTIGMMSTEMVREFFYAVCMQAGLTLHIHVPYGENDHHKAEAVFKGFGHALKAAIQVNGTDIPSTKGML